MNTVDRKEPLGVIPIREVMRMSDYSFERLVEIMEILRSENGCPWDREQTHESIKNDTLEESYELIEAIENKDDPNMLEELGDLLFHVVFHAQIAKDEERFVVDDVLKSIIDKMIRRHPHVFDVAEAEDSNQVLKQWDAIKKDEKDHKTYTDDLRSVPKAMPALMRAEKVGRKAAKIGFDFENENQLMNKLHEEVSEASEAMKIGDLEHFEEEIGDILFQIVNISRFFQINPENALTKATEKFINRFEGIEELAAAEGRSLDGLTLMQMDEYWDRIKHTDA